MKNLIFLLRKKIFIISLIIIMISFLIPKNVLAYNSQSGHPALTYEIAQFYNDNFDRKLTEEQINWLMNGSIAEDTPPRWVNHFYNPETGAGWDADKLGNVDKGMLSSFSKWAISNRTPLAANNWVSNGSAQRDYGRYGGDQSWHKALQSYVDGDMEASFYALGHILHLVEDMTVPDHTRGDTHAGLIGDKGSPYEIYVKKITENNIKGLDLAEKAKQEGLKPLNELAIQFYLTKNAKYSHDNFFSEDTIINYKIPSIIKNKLVNKDGVDYVEGYVFDGRSDYIAVIAQIVNNGSGIKFDNFTINDDRIMSAYFERLGRQAVISGAGVINLFFKDAETRRILQAKHPTAKIETNKQTNGVFSPFGELVKLSKLFNPVTKFVGNLFSQTAKTSEGENTELTNKETSVPVGIAEETGTLEEEVVEKIEIEEKENSIKLKEEDNNIILDLLQNPVIKNDNTAQAISNEVEQDNLNIKNNNQENQSLYVSRVIDGDTITLNNGKDVRLIGINTPEYGKKCFEEAKQELERLVLGKEVILKKDISEIDKYNRLLRYIYINNVLVNAEMVSSGFANIMTVPPDTKYYQNFKALEEEAKFFKRGCLFSQKKDEQESQTDQGNIISYNNAPINNIVTSYATVDSSPLDIEEVAVELAEDDSTNEEMATSTSLVEDFTEDDNNTLTTSTVGSTIVINEIQISGSSAKDEFIELYNTTTSTINLSGWKLTKKTKSGNESNLISSFPDNSLISASSYFLIITKDTSKFSATTTADTTYTGESYSIAKDNTIILKDDNDNIIDKVGYGDVSDFENTPTVNPEDGMSISRLSFIDTDNNFNDFIITTSTPQGTSSTSEVDNEDEDAEEDDEEIYERSDDVACSLPQYGTHEKKSGSVNRSLASDVLTETTLAQFNSGQTVTLTADKNPYYIDDPLTVRATSKLIIEAGVVVKFGRWRNQSGYSIPIDLIINGDLEINGTPDNPVIFTTFRDDEHGASIETSNTDPAPGDWGSLKIQSSAGHTIAINYLQVYYGGGSIDGSNSKEGGIFLNLSNADITINYSEVYYSGSGIYSRALSQPIIMNNIFSHNDLWGTYIKKNTAARIFNNSFICNGLSRGSGTTGGLGIEEDISRVELSQNNFINNQNFGLSYYTTTSTILNAANSYWGDASGPYYTSNTSTTGDAVSDNINFSPWSTVQY